MQPQTLLITDLDGTLLKSMPVAWDYLSKIAQKKGKKLKHYQDYKSTLDLYLDVYKAFGLKALKLLPRMRRYMYLNDPKIEAYPGAIDGLEQLYKYGWKIVIITDNDDDYARKVLLRNGLDSQDWVEIFSAEADTKLGLMVKVLKKYRDHKIYFASHDTKDFALLNIASLLTFKTAKKIFTPNEIDKNSLVHPQLTIAELARKLNI